MDEVDVDTIVVVLSDGADYVYDVASHPGMVAHIVPGMRPDRPTLWITIPLGGNIDDGQAV